MSPPSPDAPLRFLAVADTPADASSGAAGTDLQTVLALRTLGHHVVDLWRDALPHRIRHGNLHYAFELPGGYRKVVREHLERAPFDVVLVSQPHGYLAARWVRRHAPASIFVNRSHGWEAHVEAALAPWRRRLCVPRWRFPRGILGRPLARILLRNCDRVAAASHGILVSASACRDFIVAHHEVPPDRVACIPQAPPDDYLAAAPPAWASRRPGSVLIVGGAGFVKGVDVSAQVIRACMAQGLPLRFTWVAPATDHAALRARLQGMSQECVAIQGNVPQASLRDLYDAHQILLFPSLVEGFGKAFLEAMARGLCVVASDVGGMHDVIRSGTDGILCPAGDGAAFAAALRGLCAAPEEAERIGRAARATAEGYTWRRVAEETVGFCRVLLARQRRGAGAP